MAVTSEELSVDIQNLSFAIDAKLHEMARIEADRDKLLIAAKLALECLIASNYDEGDADNFLRVAIGDR